MRISIDFRIFASRFEKSKASSTAVARAAPSAGGEESVFAWERFALPDFLERRGVDVKDRVGWMWDLCGRLIAGRIRLWLRVC